MKYLVLFLFAFLFSGAVASQPRNDRPPAEGAIVVDPRPPHGDWSRDNHYPRWCRDYDRRDYWRERRACGDDYRCVRDVRRKAERCGLR